MGNKARSSVTVNSAVLGSGTYNGNVHVNGAAVYDGTVHVKGAAVYESTVKVAKAAVYDSTVTINNGLTINNTNSGGGTTYFNMDNENNNYIRGGTTVIDSVLQAVQGSAITLAGGQDGGTGRGLYYFSSGDTRFGQYYATSGKPSFSGGTGVTVAGFGFTGGAIRFRMNDNVDYGWIFEDSSEKVMFSVRSVDGDGYFKGSVTATSVRRTSDRKFKHDEEVLTEGLTVIRQLTPKKYLKSTDLNVKLNLHEEFGLIAQDLALIDEIKHVVKTEPGKSVEDSTLSVDYAQLFVCGIQAIKELDAIVSQQQEKINNIETVLQILPSNPQ